MSGVGPIYRLDQAPHPRIRPCAAYPWHCAIFAQTHTPVLGPTLPMPSPMFLDWAHSITAQIRLCDTPAWLCAPGSGPCQSHPDWVYIAPTWIRSCTIPTWPYTPGLGPCFSCPDWAPGCPVLALCTLLGSCAILIWPHLLGSGLIFVLCAQIGPKPRCVPDLACQWGSPQVWILSSRGATINTATSSLLPNFQTRGSSTGQITWLHVLGIEHPWLSGFMPSLWLKKKSS